MASSPVGSNSLILEVLNRNNYKDWRPRVKTYLLAEDLWEVVEAITEPAKLEDDKALYKAWRKKNAKALYAIQNSCGTEMFSFIREIELAKSAWKALEQECKVVQGYDENNADHVELYISFTQLVSSGDWDKAKECLGEVDVRSIARAKHPRDYSGDIALHVAARQGHIHIVKELVVLMTPDDLKTKNANGFTALHIAVKEGHAHIVKELVLFMSREDLKIKNNDGYTALHLAVNKGNMPIVKEFVTKEEGENNISEDNFRLYKPFRNYVNEGDWDNANKCLTELDDPCSAVTVVYPRDGYGDTALHVAAGKGHVDILKQLVLLLKERQELDLELKTAQDFTAFGSGINLGVSEQVVMERAKYMVEQYEKTLTSILEVQNAEGSTALHLAVLNGCVDIVKELVLFMRQEGLEIKDVDGDSPLQKAIRHGKVDIVKELVPLMRQEALDEKDYEGYTALGLALDVSKDEDAMAIAKFMARKNNKVVVIPTAPENDIPIICAVRASKWKLARYLYTVTPLEVLNGIDGSRFICLCLNTSKTLDLAWDLLQCFPNLAFTITEAHKTSPMLRLASMGYTFLSGTRLTFWQRWIYDFMALFKRFVKGLHKLCGIHHIYEMKSTHKWIFEFLRCMGKATEDPNLTPDQYDMVKKSIFKAIEQGHFEFVTHICKANPELLGLEDEKGRSIFHVSIENRQKEVYSLIYELEEKRRIEIQLGLDNMDNTLLHYAANLSSLPQSDHIQDASLQMQRELQWFKEVESVVPPEMHEYRRSSDNMTAHELFIMNHKKLLEDAEKSIKKTATSCTVVGALIVTIMFAVAFTVPGGNNGETGFPLFLDQKLFKVFIVSDTLSLTFSTTSVITFLGILTSRYAEDDFLKFLPTKIMIGLVTLFFAITTMMIAFSCALVIMHDGDAWIVSLSGLFASVPVISFIWLLFPLLVKILMSTYGHGIFDRKVKP